MGGPRLWAPSAPSFAVLTGHDWGQGLPLLWLGRRLITRLFVIMLFYGEVASWWTLLRANRLSIPPLGDITRLRSFQLVSGLGLTFKVNRHEKKMSTSCEENKLREIRLDAHRLWKFIEAICEEDSDDEDQEEEEEESLEEYAVVATYTHPLMTPPEDQGAKAEGSAGSLLEPVRPVHVTGQTGMTRERRKESKKSSRRQSRQTQVSTRPSSPSDDGHTCLMAKNKKEDAQGGYQIEAFKKELESLKLTYASLVSKSEAFSTNSLARKDSLEKENQVLKAKLEKLSSDHVNLQGTHMELEKSYEKLVDSHALLQVAHEVMVTTVKFYEPPTHTCTCSHVKTMLSCDEPCCSQATKSCVEHVVVDSCDDLIVQENDELKREVEKLKLELTKLKSKGQVHPSQDNRDIMVKKLERGSNVTSPALQQDQIKKTKIQPKEECLVQVKESNKGHNSSMCPIESKNKMKLTREERYRAWTRACFRCKQKGHLIAACPISQSEVDSNPTESLSVLGEPECFTLLGVGEKRLLVQVLESDLTHGTVLGTYTRTGGSSHADVGRDRTLRSKGQKRAPSGDIEGGSNGCSSNSSDDEVEDETFRVEHRIGKGPAEGDSEDEEEGVVGADGSDNDEGDGNEDEAANDAEPPVINRPQYPFGSAPTNYFGDYMTETVKRLRKENPYNEPKIAIDARFWTLFQQDFYTTVILKKSKITHGAQYVDWEHMARKNDPIFDQVIAACAEKRIKHLMGFKHSWNREKIAQFYATVYFGYYQNERAMFWMMEEERYNITFPAFVSQFCLGDDDIDFPKLHDEGVLEPKEMHFMYPRNCRGDRGKVKNLYTYYAIQNRLFRKTLTPRDGNTSDGTLFQRNLMAAMRPGLPQFSVGDFIWQEIKNLSENPQKICSYSPYIMYMIKKTTEIKFPSDVSHKPLRPPVTKTPRIPSPPAAADEEEEIRQEEQQQRDTQQEAGLTGSPNRFDQLRPGQQSHSHRQHEKPSSPIKKIISFLVGMRKSQRDIEVDQKRQWRARKKERDSIEMMHNSTNLQPPRSPISPTPPEVELPSVEARLSGYLNSRNLDQYGSMLYPPHGPQDRGYFGSASADDFSSVIYGQPPPMYAAPPRPSYGDIPSSSHGAASYQGMPPPPQPHRPSAVDQMAASLGASLFGPPPSDPTIVHQWDIATPLDNGDDQ
ncbi:hypothetical protein C2845_PM13G17720 [Panicum miliaceum]|uniref:CCHC-type domain-containing protein n=1 Tax=Panicum miliaceum TaxID=4540 RepID=A0A3L6RI10_PANMI|nr:hypothetical protein C2845_PM13G17720 [Panicum miliaceum]